MQKSWEHGVDIVRTESNRFNLSVLFCFRIWQRIEVLAYGSSKCRDGYRKPDPCKNSYIYETARDWHVKEIMRAVLVERPDVVETVNGIIDRVVKDEVRKERVKTVVAEFGRKQAEQLVADDEDFLLAIKAIRFFPDYHIEAELVDGSRMEMELKPCWPEERKRRHQ